MKKQEQLHLTLKNLNSKVGPARNWDIGFLNSSLDPKWGFLKVSLMGHSYMKFLAIYLWIIFRDDVFF